MGDALDVATEIVKPDRVFAELYDRAYVDDKKLTATKSLASIVIRGVFKKEGVEVARGPVHVSDGTFTPAMKDVYEAARKPVYDAAAAAAYAASIGEGKSEGESQQDARTAGNEAVIAAGITPGDPTAEWADVQTQVAAGVSAQSLVKMLASTDWGILILRRAWRKAIAR